MQVVLFYINNTSLTKKQDTMASELSMCVNFVKEEMLLIIAREYCEENSAFDYHLFIEQLHVLRKFIVYPAIQTSKVFSRKLFSRFINKCSERCTLQLCLVVLT